MGDVAENPLDRRAEPQAREIFGGADSAARDDERHKIVERYAAAYVELGTWAAAYRRCFDASRMSSASVWKEAAAMSQYPGVRDRVRELLAEASQRAIITVAEVLRMNVELATANPAELVRVSSHNCRHCHGLNNEYQWRDPDEYAEACARELDEAVQLKRVPKLPSDVGGYGFTIHAKPSRECEHCAGIGESRVALTDTSELSGSAAKLLKGIKQDRFGAITIELHDQQKALAEVARILGAYKDGLAVTLPPKPAESIPADVPRERVAELYLSMVR